MKRSTFLIVALLSLIAMCSFVPAGGNGVVSLWREYEKARAADRVDEMEDALERIRRVSFEHKYPWDYFEASEKYADLKISRNWKSADSIRRRTARDIEAYGLEVMNVMYALRHWEFRDSVRCRLEASEKQMRRARTLELYRNSSIIKGRVSEEWMKDDNEFALWEVIMSMGVKEKWAVEALELAVKDRYPAAPYLQIVKACGEYDADKERELLEKLSEEYKGRGIGLLARDRLLGLRFRELAERDASSDQYRILYEEAAAMRQAKNKILRSEPFLADQCSEWKWIEEHLKARNASCSISDGMLQLLVRNLDRVTVSVRKGGETIKEMTLENPVRSFYVCDTLRADLPAMDDGEYDLVIRDGRDVIGDFRFPKYTISLARCRQGGGVAVYAADHLTGEPVCAADLVLYKGDRKVLEHRGFRFDGFTLLPEDVASGAKESGHYLVCRMRDASGVIRMSRRLNVHVTGSTGSKARMSAVVMKDRGAYVPGDTVRFKAVGYMTCVNGRKRTVAKGTPVSVGVYGVDGKMVEERELRANSYGSVAGDFVLGKGGRNGRYSLRVKDDKGRLLGRSDFVVEDYVLDSYVIDFDDPGRFYMRGDTMKVSGKVVSLAGAGCSGLEVVADISGPLEYMDNVPVSLGYDGSFEVKIPTGGNENGSVWCTVNLKVKTPSGEVLEKSRYVGAETSLRPVLDLVSEADAMCEFETEGAVHLGVAADDNVQVTVRVGQGAPGLDVRYKLMRGGKVMEEGTTASGDTLDFDMSGHPSGLYEVKVDVSYTAESGRRYEGKRTGMFLLVRNCDESLDPDVCRLFKLVSDGSDGSDLVLQAGAGKAPVWYAVEIFDRSLNSVWSEVVQVGGDSSPALRTLRLSRDELPEGPLRLFVLTFMRSSRYVFDRVVYRPVHGDGIRLRFNRFCDKALPNSECTVSIGMPLGAEAAAAVYDVASEQIGRNVWSVAGRSYANVPSLMSAFSAGSYGYGSSDDEIVVGYGTKRKNSSLMIRGASAGAAAQDEAIPFQLVDGGDSYGAVRDDFSTTLAFEPFIYPDADGSAELRFRTSDKLSTFAVAVYAHNHDMDNAYIRREMMVTLPVQVSMKPPRFLYEGDVCMLSASVSNVSESDASGTLSIALYDGADHKGEKPYAVQQRKMVVPAGSTLSHEFEIVLPENADTLGIKLMFVGESSDGMFVTVPVKPAEQVVREAHSAVLLDGMDEASVLEELRGRFANGSHVGAEYSVSYLADMLRDAVTGPMVSDSKNAVVQSEAMLVNLLAVEERYAEEAVDAMRKILACANSDGGFGWFEGMTSSPVVTAYILERYASARAHGALEGLPAGPSADVVKAFDDAVVKAAGYLDKVFFGAAGGAFRPLSLLQYMHVRSAYPEVSFDKEAARKAAGTKEFRKICKEAAEMLSSRNMGTLTAGNALAKVRTLEVLHALGRTRDMEKGIRSLLGYAVDHPSGGIYYPNAVMPWGGLLESEALAHSRICDFLRKASHDEGFDEDLREEMARTADGICIWMMLQKEAQQWQADHGYVEALASVRDASEAVMQTRIIVLKKNFLKPFDEVAAVGNGMKVDLKYYRETVSGGKKIRREISEGQMLKVGEKVIAVCTVWSQENRSFVCLSVPRPSSLQPVIQRSGHEWGTYREVMAGRTCRWIEILPEETVNFEEELFVTQQGAFSAPAPEVECLYAPHYRANGVMSRLSSAR